MSLPGFFVARRERHGTRGRAQPSSVERVRRRSFIASGLLFTMSSATPTCCRRATCFPPARSDEWPGRQSGHHQRAKGRSHDQNLGANTSVNVQKVMWAVGELELPHERIDVGGAFGKNKEPAYLAMNPNGLVPTLEEEDGFLLWESNAIVRYLAAKYGAGKLEPADAHS